MNISVGGEYKGTPATTDPVDQDSSPKSLKGAESIYKFIEENSDLLSSLPEDQKLLLLNKNYADLTPEEKALLERHFKVSLTEEFFTGLKSFYNVDTDGSGKIEAKEKEEIETLRDKAQKDANSLTAEEKAKLTAADNIQQRKFEAINTQKGKIVHGTGDVQN